MPAKFTPFRWYPTGTANIVSHDSPEQNRTKTHSGNDGTAQFDSIFGHIVFGLARFVYQCYLSVLSIVGESLQRCPFCTIISSQISIDRHVGIRAGLQLPTCSQVCKSKILCVQVCTCVCKIVHLNYVYRSNTYD